VETRKRYAQTYNEAFAGIDELELPPDDSSCRNSWHLYAIRLNLEKLNINRDEFVQLLRKKGIGASVHFIPIPLHPYFAKFAQLRHNQCPKALELYPRLVSLPLYPEMTTDQVTYVAGIVKEVCQNAKKRKLAPVLDAV
jgi:dTDP-4-amino-4,6-dideoxygalactose transaminase